MIDSLSVRFFLDTHPDLTLQQAVKWMKVEERMFGRCAETVKAPVVRV